MKLTNNQKAVKSMCNILNIPKDHVLIEDEGLALVTGFLHKTYISLSLYGNTVEVLPSSTYNNDKIIKALKDSNFRGRVIIPTIYNINKFINN